jgi:hypothetical protein
MIARLGYIIAMLSILAIWWVGFFVVFGRLWAWIWGI